MDITKLLSEDVSHSFPLTVEDAFGAVLPMSTGLNKGIIL